MKKKRAVILLSGGLDSATALGIAKHEGFECYALSFSYGQRHDVEINAAKQISSFFKVKEHLTVNIDLSMWGGSALTSDEIKVPDYREENNNIPVTYVPGRNTIFLSFAISWAEVLGAKDIFIGVNSVDYSGYPDCRPEFISAFEKVAMLGTKACEEGWKFKIHAPLQSLNKSEIISKGTELGIDYSITHSCYNPDQNGKACGRCDSCVLRKKGFIKAGIEDPTEYA